MTTGAVIYAGRNSRLKNFAYKDLTNRVLGYRYRDKLGNQPGGTKIPGQHLRLSYEIALLAGGTIQVGSAVTLNKRKPNDAWSPATSAIATGVLNYEEVHDVAGTAVLRHDSNGMFAVIAAGLRKKYSLPADLVRSFDNVHDDLEDGGTSKDSKKNFFAELKKMKGTELDFFAYAGHGNYNGLPSAGVYMSDIDDLEKEINRLIKADGSVMLYACSCASGFAQHLSRKLGNRKVWAHTGAGTADKNPNMHLFQNGLDQHFLGEKNFTKDEVTAWKRYLKLSDDFYMRFPFMTIQEMKNEIT